MLVLGRKAQDLKDGRQLAEKALLDGSALEKFRILVEAQGGDVSYINDPGNFPPAKYVQVIEAPRGGWMTQVHARKVGEAAVALGAGRAKKGDSVDHAVGFIIHTKVGDIIKKGQPLFTIHANDKDKLVEARELVLAAHVISDKRVSSLPLFYE